MENLDKEKFETREQNTNQPVEHDYEAHKENPGPSIEAVTEKNDKSVGDLLKWIIPGFIIVMFAIYYFVFRQP